jgi:hypothetical protein
MQPQHLPGPSDELHWRVVVWWLAGTVTVATLGAYLAYGPLSSAAWQCWSGQTAWKRDSLRVLLSAILALLLLRNMGVISLEARRSVFKLKRLEVIVLLLVFAVLIAAELTALSDSFVANLPSRGCTLPTAAEKYRQIYFPYLPYTLYMVALWIGIVFPVLLFLVRSVQADLLWSRNNWMVLQDSIAQARAPESNALARTYRELVLRFEDYVLGLKAIAQRYIPVIFAVSIILFYEQLTPSSRTVTQAAVEGGKVGLWILLGPTLVVCLVLVVYRYQLASEATVLGLSAVAANPAADDSLFDSALERRSNLSWERGAFQFVLSLFQSATFTIAFLVAVSSYALSSVVQGEELMYLLVPKAVIEFLKRLFS